MHSPNEGNDNKFSFELLDANGGLGDVFSSLEKPDWLVWCYKSMVLVCDAKAFLAELKSTYNSNDLQDLAAFTADFINELNAAKGKKDTADVINKYTGVVGDFAIYVRQNDGRLFRGSNGEFMVEISAKALTRRFPVQEYQTLNGALKRNKPEMDEAMADQQDSGEWPHVRQDPLAEGWTGGNTQDQGRPARNLAHRFERNQAGADTSGQEKRPDCLVSDQKPRSRDKARPHVRNHSEAS